MRKNSKIMDLLLALKLEPMAWSLRRFHTPVPHDALVLEVGSGGNPYPRANVLLDAYENTRERHWVPLTSDRPTVLGFVEKLPFKDKAFDFVIASHVLEHSADPAKFLSELQRVANAGYIEVPDAFLERINPYRDHRLEITCRDQMLKICKKKSWINDDYVVELYEDRVKRHLTTELVPKRPFDFHVRYYWEGGISYLVTNPDVDANWEAPEQIQPSGSPSLIGRIREWCRQVARDLLSQRARNKQLNVLPLLQCPQCSNGQLGKREDRVSCSACGTDFPIRNGVFVMNEVLK